MSSRFSPISDYPHSPVVEQIIERIERSTSGDAQRADMFEVIWPGMDKYLKAFVAPADAPGLYLYEIKIGKRVVLTGGGDKAYLARFLPQLRTFSGERA